MDHEPKSKLDANAETTPVGTTNPELFRSRGLASTMYIVAAMERFEKLPKKQVQQIAFEIGVLGMSGLDYASPKKEYQLNALPKWRCRYTPREVEKNKDVIGDVFADADRHFARLFRRKCLELRTSARLLLVSSSN